MNVIVTIPRPITVTAVVAVQLLTNGGVVEIKNQFDEVVASVTAPGEYQVLELLEVDDNEPYDTSGLIIDDAP